MTARPARRALGAALLATALAAGPATAAPALGAPLLAGTGSAEEESSDAEREGEPQPGGGDSPEVVEDEGLEVEDATGRTWLAVLAIAACSAIVVGAGALRRPGASH